jgi:hypothetical protein
MHIYLLPQPIHTSLEPARAVREPILKTTQAWPARLASIFLASLARMILPNININKALPDSHGEIHP